MVDTGPPPRRDRTFEFVVDGGSLPELERAAEDVIRQFIGGSMHRGYRYTMHAARVSPSDGWRATVHAEAVRS